MARTVHSAATKRAVCGVSPAVLVVAENVDSGGVGMSGLKEPLTHIRRSPLPWRESDLTECGRPAQDYAAVVDWEGARRLAKEYGQQRFALLFCMTCTSTTQRWPTWDSDPLERLGRERRGNEALIQRELRVIAALIEAHRDEFDQALAGLDDVGDLASRRAAKRVVGGSG